jgi:coenzyme F420-reducing hydrogenase beta subunit
MIQEICPKDSCTGCFACKSVCKSDAIYFKNDELGHYYPHINENCINCNSCVKICPANNKIVLNSPIEVFASWSIDFSERITSASGGVATEISKRIVENKGVVYGCTVKSNIDIQHIRIDSLTELFKLKGSKYVQSSIENCYKNIKKDLQNNKKVLFIGTPCQVSGIKKFIGSKNEDLYLVDFVCHGVPSEQILKQYIVELLPNEQQKLNVKFRNSKGQFFEIFKENQLLYSKRDINDWFYIGFRSNLFFRSACYNCAYTKVNRISDITLGDFWGLGKNIPFNHETNGGVSLVMVNSRKGVNLLNECKDRLFMEKREVNEAISGNIHLSKPSVMNKNRKLFVKMIKNNSINKSLFFSLWMTKLKYHLILVLKFLKIMRFFSKF